MTVPPPSPTRPPKIPEISPIRRLTVSFPPFGKEKHTTKQVVISTPECRRTDLQHPKKDKNIRKVTTLVLTGKPDSDKGNRL
jgi:hypothetical protein